MRLTVFGSVMAVVLLISLIVAVSCAVIILEGLGTPWVLFGISVGICILLATAFNIEGRR